MNATTMATLLTTEIMEIKAEVVKVKIGKARGAHSPEQSAIIVYYTKDSVQVF